MFWDRTTLAAAGDGENGRSGATEHGSPSELRDLSDFANRWPEFRPQLVEFLENPQSPEDIAEITRWLVLLADRVCQLEDL